MIRVREAARRLQGKVRVTPCLDLEPGAFGLPGHITLKLEQHQHTGSFKVRGVYNKLLTSTIPLAGVVTASGGNHGMALAFVARELGVPCRIYVPEVATPYKLAQIRKYGAAVQVEGAVYAEAAEAAQRYADFSGALNVPAFDDPAVVEGQGTLAFELEQQRPSTETVLTAVGGGGFIAGLCSWYQGRVKVVSVEPDGSPTLQQALLAKKPVDIMTGGIAADSLGCRRIGSVPFSILQDGVAQAVLVSDEVTLRAQRLLWDELRIMAEPGGATAFAALLSGAYQPGVDERVNVIICGGNVDPHSFPVGA
ncbi:Threonine dehydratase [Deinococcus saxicola]|uniref:threonine/serine dehydratase n=1 Tax=Deinococcus saxicola TaxID=249406 RepID=UPI0039EEB1F0